MHVLSIGLNHTTAPVEIRERAAVAADHLDDALVDIAKYTDIEEATILSTCNRTEVYCYLPSATIEVASDWLCNFHELDKDDVTPYLYSLPDSEAVCCVKAEASPPHVTPFFQTRAGLGFSG